MSRYINHVVKRHGTNVSTDAISDADVPIHRNVVSVDAQFGWGFDGAPDVVTVMFTYNLTILLKIRINWHKKSPIRSLGSVILGFLRNCFEQGTHILLYGSIFAAFRYALRYLRGT
jgi:hypothetical protein